MTLNEMKTAVKVLCFGVVMGGFGACNQKDSQSNVPMYVEIVGNAEKEVEPDVFYLSFTLREPDNAKKNDINVQEQRMLAALQSLDIDAKSDLSVTSMSGDSWYWWRKTHTVYQRKSYLLKINHLDLVNRTCDKLDSLKVSYHLSKVDYSEMDELKKEVQQEAVKNARQKAENLLRGENKQVGELIYLQEQEVFSNQSRFNNYYAAYDNAPRQESSPAFRKMNVSYSVIARFSIK